MICDSCGFLNLELEWNCFERCCENCGRVLIENFISLDFLDSAPKLSEEFLLYMENRQNSSLYNPVNEMYKLFRYIEGRHRAYIPPKLIESLRNNLITFRKIDIPERRRVLKNKSLYRKILIQNDQKKYIPEMPKIIEILKKKSYWQRKSAFLEMGLTKKLLKEFEAKTVKITPARTKVIKYVSRNMKKYRQVMKVSGGGLYYKHLGYLFQLVQGKGFIVFPLDWKISMELLLKQFITLYNSGNIRKRKNIKKLPPLNFLIRCFCLEIDKRYKLPYKMEEILCFFPSLKRHSRKKNYPVVIEIIQMLDYSEFDKQYEKI